MRHTFVLLVVLLLGSVGWADDKTQDFTVVVVDGQGQGVAGALVYATPERELMSGVHSTVTDEAGRITLPDLDPRLRYQLSAIAPHERGDLSNASVDSWVPKDGLQITLPPGRVIKGTVVDEEGRPDSGTLCYRTEFDRSGARPCGSRFRLGNLEVGTVHLLVVEGRAPDVFRLSHNESAPWVTVPVETDEVELTIWRGAPERRRRVFAVRVQGPGGVVPAVVLLDAGYWSPHTTMTTRRGLQRVDLEEQDGKLAFVRAFAARDAAGTPLPWAPTRVDVPPGTRTVEVEMPAGVEVRGRAVDEAGAPVVDVQVLARDVGGTGPSLHAGLSRAWTTADGTFRLVGLGETPLELTTLASADWPAAAPVACRGGDSDVVITLRKAREVTIHLVDGAGEPVVGAAYTLWQRRETPSGLSGSSLAMGVSDAEGRFVLPPVDPALSMTLEIEVPESRDDLVPIHVKPWVPESRTLTMSRGFAVRLRVLDEHDRPVRASVRKRMPNPNAPFEGGGWSSVGETDAEGAVVARGLAPDEDHEFAAFPTEASDVFPACSHWTKASPSEPEIILRLPTKGHRMTIRTEGARQGQLGALFAPDAEGVFSSAYKEFVFKADGVTHVENIAAGTYVVIAFAQGIEKAEYQSGQVGPLLFAGADVELTLRPKVLLRVLPVAPPNATGIMGGVHVHGLWLHLQQGKEGQLETDLLPEGRYPVTLLGEVGDDPVRGEAWAQTGETTRIELTHE